MQSDRCLCPESGLDSEPVYAWFPRLHSNSPPRPISTVGGKGDHGPISLAMEVTVCRYRRSERGRRRNIPSTCACPSAIQVMPNTHTPRENHPDLRCVRPRAHHLRACRTTRRKAQVTKVCHVWPLGPGTRPHSPTCEELLGVVGQVLCLCPERKGLRRWLVGGSERRVQTVHAGHRPLSLPVRPIDGRELRQCPGIAPSHRRRQQSRCGRWWQWGAQSCTLPLAEHRELAPCRHRPRHWGRRRACRRRKEHGPRPLRGGPRRLRPRHPLRETASWQRRRAGPPRKGPRGEVHFKSSLWKWHAVPEACRRVGQSPRVCSAMISENHTAGTNRAAAGGRRGGGARSSCALCLSALSGRARGSVAAAAEDAATHTPPPPRVCTAASSAAFLSPPPSPGLGSGGQRRGAALMTQGSLKVRPTLPENVAF